MKINISTRKKSLIIIFFLIFALPFALACRSQLTGEKTSVQETAAETAPKTDIRPDWQREWESTIQAAKKEGKVVIYGSPKPEAYAAIAAGFKKAYGLDVETVTGRSAQIVAKILTEKRAGLHLGDVILVGGATAVTELGPSDLLAVLDPIIILPEVRDDKIWYKKSFANQMLDPGHLSFTFMSALDIPMARNTRLVGPEDIKEWEDLLQPAWKGKLLVNDPTTTGKGQSNFAMIGKMKGWDFWRALVRQNPTMNRDNRLQMDWLAQGKFPILISPSTSSAQEFIDVGAPVAFIRLKGDNYTTSSGGVVSVFKQGPHPNAMKVFVNYLLSKEGQTLWSRADGMQSAREDISTEGLDPIRVRAPGIIYPASDDWEFYMWREKNKIEEIAKEIVGPLIK